MRHNSQSYRVETVHKYKKCIEIEFAIEFSESSMYI